MSSLCRYDRSGYREQRVINTYHRGGSGVEGNFCSMLRINGFNQCAFACFLKWSSFVDLKMVQHICGNIDLTISGWSFKTGKNRKNPFLDKPRNIYPHNCQRSEMFVPTTVTNLDKLKLRGPDEQIDDLTLLWRFPWSMNLTNAERMSIPEIDPIQFMVWRRCRSCWCETMWVWMI